MKSVLGDIIIRKIWKEENGDATDLKCRIDISDRNEDGTETVDAKEIRFTVPSEYSDYLLTERCDAYVVLLVRYAVSNGYNIRSDIPVSNDLYYNLKEQFMPPFVKNDGYRSELILETASSVGGGSAVGTGLSCGVDSLYTVMRMKDYPDPEFRLTHLCINNVGAFNGLYRMEGIEKVRKGMYENARRAAAEIGLPLIETDSDVDEVMHQNHYLTHSYTSSFAIFCLKKLWKYYFYASSGVDCITGFSIKGHLMFPPSKYELLTMSCFSTPSMRIYIDAATVARYDKTVALADYPVAQRHLVSCTSSYANCSRCDKCMRNIMALDSVGKLDSFSGIYDTDLYRNFKYRYMWYLFAKKDDHYFEPVFENFRAKGDEEFIRTGEIFDALEEFDGAWRSGNREWTAECFARIKEYADAGDMHAASRVGRAYKHGIGTEKDEEEAQRYWEISIDSLRQEIADGFNTSRIRLFDILWGTGDEKYYPEMAELLRPLLDAEDMSAIARRGRMSRDGRGVPKDIDDAVAWFRWAYRKDPVWLQEYCSLLLGSGREEYYREAREVCMERCDRSARYAYGFLGRIYREGKGVKKDLHEAAKWYSLAVENGVEWAPVEYFDVIWTFNDRMEDMKLRDLVRAQAESGSVPAMGRLGKVYHYGRGVPQDLHLARRWLRRAQDRDPIWFPELYETLMASGDRFRDEAHRRCVEQSDAGVKHAYLYRARMLRDGDGCDRDLDQAVEWYRKGVSEGVAMAAVELFEIFWSNPSDVTDKEMVDAILPFANQGSPAAMGRLGRAYRFGRGVPKSYAMAERWTAKACEKDPARWGKGLEAIRLKRKSGKSRGGGDGGERIVPYKGDTPRRREGIFASGVFDR